MQHVRFGKGPPHCGVAVGAVASRARTMERWNRVVVRRRKSWRRMVIVCVLKVWVGTRKSEVFELSDDLRAVNVRLGIRLSAATLCNRLPWRWL
jgi:hypothetical protein